ncbi:hypothetical protein GCM10009677_58350 [Sphaerisporangium rubeum]
MGGGWGLAPAGWGVGLAALGAAFGQLLGTTPLAVLGATVGAVSGAFAPTIYDAVRDRNRKQDALPATAELVSTHHGPASLLAPDRRVVSFAGREAELAALEAWCADPVGAPMRLVTGPGGVGKTRLMLELAARLGHQWGFVVVTEDQEATALAHWREVTDKPLLLVVDYAETRERLNVLVRSVVGDGGGRVRLLLLARSEGEWWDRLGSGERPVREAHARATVEQMVLSADVAAGVSDADLIDAAVGDFARVLGVEPAPSVVVDADEGRGRMLDLHAAALVGVLTAAQEAGVGAVRVDLGVVLEDLLSHEVRFWLGSAEAAGLCAGPSGLTVTALGQVVAAGTLLGAADRASGVALLGRVPGVPQSVKVAEWLGGLYPAEPGQGWLGGLRPDRLAELHVTRQLAESPELAAGCLTDLDEGQARQALTVLGRASADYEPARELLGRILPLISGVAASLEAPRETLEAISAAIPFPSLAMAEADAIIVGKILATFPAGDRSGEYARWLSLSASLTAQLGRPGEALPVEQQAVTIRRELAELYPDRYRPDLADSLSNLGITFSELGRPNEALPVTQEAVTIYRELAELYSHLYRPDLAASLSDLGIRFWELGRPDEALPAAQEAVTIRRELAGLYPDRYRPDLADSLSNLGITFSELGRPREALPVTQEATTIYRELAELHPDRYRPDLAASLSNLGVYFSQLGRPDEALPVTQEAATIYRELAGLYPDRYRPDLAGSLSNLGIRFSELGRPDEALPATQEATTIYRELAGLYPDRYRPDLAGSLSNLGVRFSELGRPDEALPATQEAVTIRRELAGLYPDRYRADLAVSLSNLGAWLSELGRPDEALPATQEAATIYRELAGLYPDRYRADLAGSLSNLGVWLSELGRLDEALPATQEAVTIYRELAGLYPDRYRADLAVSLSNLGNRLWELGRPDEALSAEQEAVTIRRELAELHPDLADSLSNLGSTFSELGHPDETDEAAREVSEDLGL